MADTKKPMSTPRKICWVLLIILMLILSVLVIYNAVVTSQSSDKYPIVDTRVYQSESLKAGLFQKLPLLFSITDDQSYDLSCSQNNISSELKARLFPEDNYSESPEKFTVQTALYTISDDNTYKFLVYLASDNKEITLQAVYSDTQLVDLISLD